MTAAPRRFDPTSAGNIATVTVVAVAFIVTYFAYFVDLRTSGDPPFSAAALALATGFGVLYLILMIYWLDDRPPFTGRYGKASIYILLVALMLAIEFLLGGSNAIWLISMPLVASAATDLPPGPHWLVYLAALFGVAASTYLYYGNFFAPILSTLTFITAFVFVIAFVRLTQAAGLAQVEAERLAAQLAHANGQLGQYAVQAEELATIQERNRLAREIHDNLGHYLTVVSVQIKAAQALMEKDPPRAAAALDKAGQLTQEGLAAVRGSVSALRESPLGRRPLAEAIAALAAETQAAGIVADLRVNGPPRPLDPRAELTLYRAAQEGLTNTRKHARASRVDLLLDYSNPAAVSLTVRDNGLGVPDGQHPPGFGLLGLEERARQLGGRVTIETAPGTGYCLLVELPAITPAAAEGARP